MDEIWDRAVETALDGETDHAAVRNLTLDGAVKCVHGRLPHPSVFERFPNLQHLSLANIGVSSLEQFPRLGNLQKLVLSDNRIAGGLECLVDAGLRSLVDLDLSNNRIQYIEDLAPLAEFQLVSLDLYECPVTRVKDYRTRVFGLIKSLKYLDKMDSEENETPETDDEEEEDEEEEEEDDPGSGEVDGGDRLFRKENGHNSVVDEGILDVDDEEDEESDADEEETEIERNGQSSHHESNGFQLARADKIGDEEDDDEIEEEDSSSGEEIDEEDDDDDEVVEVHEAADSGDEDDRMEFDEEDEEVGGDEDDDEEEVDNEEHDMGLPSSTGQLASTEGEIDGHEQGEDDAFEDDNGETGEEDEQGVEEEVGYEEEDAEDEDDDDEEEENGSGYLVQPVNQQAIADEVDDGLSGGSDMEPVNDEEDEEEDNDNEDLYGEEDVEDDLQDDHQAGQFQMPPSSSSSHFKRKRFNEDDEDEESSDSGDDDDGGGDAGRQAKMPKNDV